MSTVTLYEVRTVAGDLLEHVCRSQAEADAYAANLLSWFRIRCYVRPTEWPVKPA